MARIAYLHQYFATPSGSSGTRSFEFASRLSADGHDVTVFTMDAHVSGLRDELEGLPFRVRVLPVTYRQEHGSLRRLLSWACFVVWSIATVLLSRPSLVIASSTPLTVAIPALVVRRVARIPFVFEVRDLWPQVPIALGRLPSASAKRFAHALADAAYRHACAVVALSPDMARGIQERRPELDVTVVPNGGGAPRRGPCAPTLEGLPLERAILYAGALGQVNNPTYLAELAYHLAEAGSDLVVVVVGEGSQREEMLARARALGVEGNRLLVVEKTPKRELQRAIVRAQYAISTVRPIPALAGNSANKVFEALALGTPVLINHGGWLADELERAGVGLVLDTDPAAAARQIAGVAVSEHMAMRGRLKDEAARYSWNHRYTDFRLAVEGCLGEGM